MERILSRPGNKRSRPVDLNARILRAEYSEPIKEINKGLNCIGINKFNAIDIVKRWWKEAPSLWSPAVRSSSISQKL
ncbi:hypothetical protein RHMOL_Rhmol05G0286400 [Rhododendron molle]|uniref:Uncharacterized protein n=1 Tax=Rhododendron molle TaxID=49168 RepID=A0ACC0NVB7_RHOML|nr:hypothetical protein RHMOL_Rhmol05G0286400 [Rhododendron molle]